MKERFKSYIRRLFSDPYDVGCMLLVLFAALGYVIGLISAN